MDSTLEKQGVKSALAELRSTTGGLQTVLFVVCRLKSLKTQAFFALTSKITSIVTSKMGILFEDSSTLWYVWHGNASLH